MAMMKFCSANATPAPMRPPTVARCAFGPTQIEISATMKNAAVARLTAWWNQKRKRSAPRDTLHEANGVMQRVPHHDDERNQQQGEHDAMRVQAARSDQRHVEERHEALFPRLPLLVCERRLGCALKKRRYRCNSDSVAATMRGTSRFAMQA